MNWKFFIHTFSYRCNKVKKTLKITTILALVFMSIQVQAQTTSSIYLEGLGNAFLGASINYEIRFGENENGPGFRIGIDIAGSGAIPILANQVFGSEQHKIEIGAGTTIFTSQVDQSGFRSKGASFTGSLGYRFHAQSGLLFRAAWTPIVGDSETKADWIGLSIGWRF